MADGGWRMADGGCRPTRRCATGALSPAGLSLVPRDGRRPLPQLRGRGGHGRGRSPVWSSPPLHEERGGRGEGRGEGRLLPAQSVLRCTSRRSTSPRVFWGRCESRRAEGARPGLRSRDGSPTPSSAPRWRSVEADTPSRAVRGRGCRASTGDRGGPTAAAWEAAAPPPAAGPATACRRAGRPSRPRTARRGWRRSGRAAPRPSSG
jgi:hypothetical protein